MPAIAALETRAYRVPLPVVLSDSTHGTISHFELITAQVRDADGAEGLGYTYTVDSNGLAVHAVIDKYLRRVVEGADASRIEDFDFAAFKDQYTEHLTELIQKKVEGEEVVQVAESEEPRILNLMDALKKSVAEAQAGAQRKMAPSAPSAKAAKKTRRKKSG